MRWSQSDCVDFSAAFAYYALQSIFPLLLIALAVAATVFGNTNGVDEVLSAILPLLPPSVGDLVQSTLIGLVRQGFGAGLLGVVVLVLTASNLYLTLQRGADRLWDSLLPPDCSQANVRGQVLEFLRNRLQAFLVVLAVATLVVMEQIITGLGKLPQDLLESVQGLIPLLGRIIDNRHIFFLGSIVLPALWLSLLALALQRVLSSRKIPLRPLIPGSLLIGLALSLLNLVLGLSIVSLGNRFQAYGVIGGVLVLTLWVWLIGVVFYYGECLSVELVGASLRRQVKGEQALAKA
ncbi:YhjD/YihY/BrkB family envelope integrity protein [Synechococcus sp. MIT S1220]|uniref:YhjD/YihY/BrkB family envelope integrity protein n=1 Tax=Synechococcus sp. MIT S1220 TaxID=3082549 RepID=UPI0039AFCEA6